MFKFNFFEESSENKSENAENDKDKDVIQLRNCEEISISNDRYNEIVENIENINLSLFSTENFVGTVLDLETIRIVGKDLEIAGSNNSDLINGVYEGGLKIWEATEDLAKYLADDQKCGVSLKDKRILDLGCGSGILGILGVMRSAVVHFQDYNSEVLENLTIPNVILNVEQSDFTGKSDFDKCKFYAGDWDKFVEATKDDEKFDIILTAETIYNPLYYQKLLNVFKSKLKPNGIIFLAAKVFYFGVGGSLREFEAFLEKDGTFCYSTVFQIEEDVFREVLKITFK